MLSSAGLRLRVRVCASQAVVGIKSGTVVWRLTCGTGDLWLRGTCWPARMSIRAVEQREEHEDEKTEIIEGASGRTPQGW